MWYLSGSPLLKMASLRCELWIFLQMLEVAVSTHLYFYYYYFLEILVIWRATSWKRQSEFCIWSYNPSMVHKFWGGNRRLIILINVKHSWGSIRLRTSYNLQRTGKKNLNTLIFFFLEENYSLNHWKNFP